MNSDNGNMNNLENIQNINRSDGTEPSQNHIDGINSNQRKNEGNNSNGNLNNKDLQYPVFQNIEPNTSYTRTRISEEDERFFKLAKEALVHTANVTQKNVDPTLNDLFKRLQYVSSPHGNPIKSGENIKVNDNGQLMIHEFYDNFPNFNNNVFERSNGLIGENPLKNLGIAPQPNDSSNKIPENISNFPNVNNLPNNLQNPNLNDLPNFNRPMQLDFNKNEEERKYECLKCSMNFKRSSDLKRHEKQHLSIPPNICEFCGKGFARKDALKRHVGTATCKRNAEKKLYIDNLEFLK
ncbi:hypothetical protein CLIB1444_16S01178 [[Candida] jaroonii]|uniref:Uncharacterized protein n=1 Tax=[Candida] jaroonii TaxID=467808 RepID=A0ACA9YG83_9ASCO|nr:hypothetical protein CLIB1444_16S01178 [[Candida] jaroonii]